MRVAGVMSGTSLDGIDVAIVDIHNKKIKPLAFHSIPYPKAVREALLSVSNNITHTATISRLNFVLGALYADAIH
jgi:anhydro-N-acetylmuramic acid kinase